jgi:dihydrofolate synthase/folylpolyglutamate synthase
MVRPEGFEPPTLCSEDRCSNPLSYGRAPSVYYSNREEWGITVQKLINFTQANKYLASLYSNKRANSGYSLDVMMSLMEHLGNPQNRLRVIHVAGTSGKTSTAYYTAALLNASGLKAGLTVSPHIDEINERIQIGGLPLTEKIFCEALTDFFSLIENTKFQPSWFEVMVAFAFWFFEKESVDYAVIEVGLGGLKDGTNVIDTSDKICIITDIGYDHMKILGNSLHDIAVQKAGIIHASNVVFSYDQPKEIMDVITNTAHQKGASLHVLENELTNNTALPEYQFRNWSLAYQTFVFLSKRDSLPPLTNESLSFSQFISIPGRMDQINFGNKIIIMDGAHNAQKMEAMTRSFKKLYPGIKPAVLISMKQGKEYEEVVPLIAPLASRIITTSFNLSQDIPLHSMDPIKLAEAFKASGLDHVDCIPNQKLAVNELLMGPEEVYLVTGSLYLLGQLRNNKLL